LAILEPAGEEDPRANQPGEDTEGKRGDIYPAELPVERPNDVTDVVWSVAREVYANRLANGVPLRRQVEMEIVCAKMGVSERTFGDAVACLVRKGLIQPRRRRRS
jgi:hypothetical protein